MIELEPKTWPRCRDGATRKTLDSLVAFHVGFCRVYNEIRLRFDGVPASRDAGMLRLWSYRGKPKAEVRGQGDGAMYGLPNRLRALLPDPTTGELRWESAGRDLVDGDETEIRTVAAINRAHLRRLGGHELTQSERLPEPHGDGGSADWQGDQTLRERLVNLNWAVNAAYYLFWFFIAKAIIVAVWLVKDEDVKRAVADADADWADAQRDGLAAGRATRQARGRAAVGEQPCAGGRAGTVPEPKGVTAIKDLLAGVAAGLVQGCKDLAAAGRHFESFDALVTYVKHEHVAICRAESELAGGEGLSPLKHAEGLGYVEWRSYLAHELRRRLSLPRDHPDAFDASTTLRASEELYHLDSSLLERAGAAAAAAAAARFAAMDVSSVPTDALLLRPRGAQSLPALGVRDTATRAFPRGAPMPLDASMASPLPSLRDRTPSPTRGRPMSVSPAQLPRIRRGPQPFEP